MSKNFKYLLIPLLLLFSLPLWWGANMLGEYLRDFFYWSEMSNNSRLLSAQADQAAFQNQIIEMKPVRIKKVPDLEISAKSALSIFVDNQGKERILFEKEKDIKLPIASLTKLMTAKIVLDNYNLEKEVKISEEAINQEENFGQLSVGQKLAVKYLLYPLLIESSNDAAYALVNDYDGISEKYFVSLMNETSQKLEMTNTQFFNSTGLEPDIPNPKINYSTAYDFSKLAKSLLKESLLWEISATPKFNIYGPELINTNELLGKLPGIVGGKTGYAEKAGGCLLLVTKAPKGKGYIVSIVLGSNNRFGEMEKLINWLDSAYIW